MTNFNTVDTLLNIQKLDEEIFKNQKNILICGNRCCGKSELVTHIISLYDKNTKFYFVTPPNDRNSSCTTFDRFTPNKFNKILGPSKFNKILEQSKENKICIVYEDLHCTLHYKENRLEDYIKASNSNISFIITTQYDMLSPVIRSYMDIIMVFNDRHIDKIKRNYDKYFGIIDSFKKYKSILDKKCNGYTTLCTYNYNIYYYNFEYIPLELPSTMNTYDMNTYDINSENNNENIVIYKENINNYTKIQIINKIIDQNQELIKILQEMNE
jgi:hypothetical protein